VGESHADIPKAITADDGTFEFDEVDGGYRVIAFANVGIAEVDRETFAREHTIKLQPWGKVEGELRVNDKAGAEQFLIVRPMQWDNISFELSARTDKAGNFKIDRLPPGNTLIGRMSPVHNLKIASSGEQQIVEVPAGATATVSLGGQGRKVVGRIALPPEFTPDADWEATEASIASPDPDGDNPRRFGNFTVERNGFFQIDDVEPGEYIMDIRLTTKPKSGMSLHELTFLGSVGMKFSMKDNDSRVTPHDLGTIKLDVVYSPKK
jgi:hypothetical protein